MAARRVNESPKSAPTFSRFDLTKLFDDRGNMCKGADNMRPGGENGFVPSKEEQFICEFERELGIQDVLFEVFERSIKRFGYCIALTDDCWRATVGETRVDVEQFKEHGNVQHSYF